MSQLVVRFVDFSVARSYWEDVGNFVSSITSRYGVEARTAIPYVIIGCLCVWIYVERYSRSKPKPKPKPMLRSKTLTRSKSFSLRKIHGGGLVLQRLDEEHKAANANPKTLDNAEILLDALLKEEHLDLMKLQTTVWKLEMSEKEETAAKKLEEGKKYHADNSHQVYEIEMLLVEMLMYMGRVEDALGCECLNHEEITDARRPLYRAILYKMKGDKDKAQNYWDNFVNIRKQFIEVKDLAYFDEEVYETITDFQQFEKMVEERLQEIRKRCCGKE